MPNAVHKSRSRFHYDTEEREAAARRFTPLQWRGVIAISIGGATRPRKRAEQKKDQAHAEAKTLGASHVSRVPERPGRLPEAARRGRKGAGLAADGRPPDTPVR